MCLTLSNRITSNHSTSNRTLSNRTRSNAILAHRTASYPTRCYFTRRNRIEPCMPCDQILSNALTYLIACQPIARQPIRSNARLSDLIKFKSHRISTNPIPSHRIATRLTARYGLTLSYRIECNHMVSYRSLSQQIASNAIPRHPTPSKKSLSYRTESYLNESKGITSYQTRPYGIASDHIICQPYRIRPQRNRILPQLSGLTLSNRIVPDRIKSDRTETHRIKCHAT